MITISVTDEMIHKLDISPLKNLIETALTEGKIGDYEQQICLDIQVSRDPQDPRELSEIPEVRLWFIRVDAFYPWFPFLLDWKGGELARYVAMLVPHQFHRREGIQYNPEALEIFLMKRIFILSDWLKSQNIAGNSKLIAFSQLLGYDLDEGFFELL